MCRVIIANYKDFKLYDKAYGSLKLFHHLEAECGGHGNGYALVKGGKIIETRKGMHLDNEEIYSRISNCGWDFLVWHTRIASVGSRSDANCHPFVAGNDCLAMNGTEYQLHDISDAFGRTDTEVIFRNLIGMSAKEATKALVRLSSVFVGCSNGIPFAVQAGGTLHRWNKGGGSLHASTFPIRAPHVERLPDGYVWLNGEEDRSRVRAIERGWYGGSSRSAYASPASQLSHEYEDWASEMESDESFDRYQEGFIAGYEQAEADFGFSFDREDNAKEE